MSYDKLPNILTPKDVQAFLGWKKDKVYALFRSRHFPAEKVGGSYIIPKPRFFKWLGVEITERGGEKMDLKNERLRKNFTQQQLADLAEVDRTLISKLESGASSPSVETAKKIAKILDFDWTKFFEENSEQESEQEGA